MAELDKLMQSSEQDYEKKAFIETLKQYGETQRQKMKLNGELERENIRQEGGQKFLKGIDSIVKDGISTISRSGGQEDVRTKATIQTASRLLRELKSRGDIEDIDQALLKYAQNGYLIIENGAISEVDTDKISDADDLSDNEKQVLRSLDTMINWEKKETF